MLTVEALETKGLSKSFRVKRGQFRQAVDNLSIRISPGDVYGFLGPNGAGKTTAIRLILGLIKPNNGQVRIHGESHPVKRLQHVGAMVETPSFFDNMTGMENLQRAFAFTNHSAQNNIQSVIEKVGLKDRANEKVKTYSLGMKQRLGIGRALLGKPRLLILDEPTNGLDPRGMKEIRDLLNELVREESLTVLISSHLLSEVELLCNRIGILDHGKLVAEGTQAELRAKLGRAEQELEIGGPNMDALERHLKAIEGVGLVGRSSAGRLRIRLTGIDVAGINAQLVSQGVGVNALIPAESSLEDSFLKLTGGDI